MSFTGALGNVDFDNDGEFKVAVKIFQIRNGTTELYTVISDRQCNETATGRSQDDEIPRIYNLQSAAITAVLLTIEAVLIILTTVILILFLYYRNAPEIKATSPYLSLAMFLGCYFQFASVTITVLSSFVIHNGVFFCTVPRWSTSLGIHLIYAPLIMRMLRVYRIFTYFGRLGKRWSDGVLYAGVVVIIGINLTFLTLLQVFDSVTFTNDEMLVTPEGAFPFYEVTQICTSPNIIGLILYDCEYFFLTIILVLLALLTRKIQRQHFKDTKKVNTFIYMEILIVYIFVPISMVIRNREIQVYLTFAGDNSTAILCQVILFLPKCLPPFLRHLKLKCWKRAPKKKQMLSANDEIAMLCTPMLTTSK